MFFVMGVNTMTYSVKVSYFDAPRTCVAASAAACAATKSGRATGSDPDPASAPRDASSAAAPAFPLRPATYKGVWPSEVLHCTRSED